MDAADAELDLLRRGPRPEGEPPFDLRAQDVVAADAARHWVRLFLQAGGAVALAELALQRIDEMDAWPVKKLPDASHIPPADRAVLEAKFQTRVWSDEPQAPLRLREIAETRIREEGFAAGVRSCQGPIVRFQVQVDQLRKDLVHADQALDRAIDRAVIAENAVAAALAPADPADTAEIAAERVEVGLCP